jgi:hypothetical protein
VNFSACSSCFAFSAGEVDMAEVRRDESSQEGRLRGLERGANEFSLDFTMRDGKSSALFALSGSEVG